MIFEMLLPVAAIGGALIGAACSRAADRRRRRRIVRRVVRIGGRIPPLRALNDNARQGLLSLFVRTGGSG